MAVTYDASKNPFYNLGLDEGILALSGSVVAKHDTNMLTTYVYAEVVAAGNIVCLPARNDDANPITITGAPVGYRIPWLLKRVNNTGTTATLVSLEKVS